MNVFRFRSFFAGYYVEADLFPFIQHFESGANYRRVMNKHILTAFLGDETESFFIVPPFYFAAGHKSLS